MDVLTGGFNEGNLIVTAIIILALIVGSSKAKMLDSAGVAAAAFIGLVVGGMGHWTWLLILLAFLISSHKATKWRFEEKKSRNMSESDDGHRGWINVLANGGLPAIVAAMAFFQEDWGFGIWMFSAAVAVAAADTFASEIGCLDDNVRMITTLKPCEAGLNGGFSATGQKAALIGSALIGCLAFFAWYITNLDSEITDGFYLSILTCAIGWIGCQVDSWLGAVFENRGYLTKNGVNALAITSGMMFMWAWLRFI
jgi:uncharacterized protein (TIGR00297 family)